MKYAVIVTCYKTPFWRGEYALHRGEWTSADLGISIPENWDGVLRRQTLLFDTPAAAESFMESWKSFPAYIKIKSYRIISVKPNMVTIQNGWKIA